MGHNSDMVSCLIVVIATGLYSFHITILFLSTQTTSLDELQTNPPALYSEVDLVGVVVSVTSHNR